MDEKNLNKQVEGCNAGSPIPPADSNAIKQPELKKKKNPILKIVAGIAIAIVVFAIVLIGSSAFLVHSAFHTASTTAKTISEATSNSSKGTQEAKPEDTAQTANTAASKKDTTSSEKSSGLRPEFKAAMDKYEKWFDDYIAVTEKYKKNPNDAQALQEYTKLTADEVRMLDELKNLDSSDWNAEEQAYYIELQGRISSKLVKASS